MKAVLMLLALVLLALAGVIGVQRANFVRVAVPTSGIVVDIESRNTRCGRKPRRACTKFTAVVEYTVANDTRRMRTGAGQSRGRDEPESEARFDVGDAFPLRVHPGTREAFPDDTMGLWGLPILLGLGGGVFAVFGLWGAGRRR
ncbi:DUF3592 domain-containing protein [Silanimonas sp.]|uniref:DUF3592 domain-containing protein n=1 Tax=Silanimonas sp. TaxID=1929290 RepID=UPI0022BAE905|nr:DUF3592 domain-containing protein [Silanimonas sp.]MCZ8061709.1 DUF3592 domain-containing protein [Silanimonas sp.]